HASPLTGTVTVSCVADAAVTIAETPSTVTAFASGVVPNDVPVIVAVAPGVRTAGVIAVIVGPADTGDRLMALDVAEVSPAAVKTRARVAFVAPAIVRCEKVAMPAAVLAVGVPLSVPSPPAAMAAVTV